MDKINRKSHRINGHKNQRLGIPLGIHDKNGIELLTGDKIHWRKNDGIVLWDLECNEYWFFLSYSKWYGDDEYDCNSYGKGYRLPMDDGAKMEITKLAA